MPRAKLAPQTLVPEGSMVLPRETVMKIESLTGCPVGTNPERLVLAVARSRVFSIEGTEITLESDLLERIRSRSLAGRELPGEYLKREVVRLLRSEVGI